METEEQFLSHSSNEAKSQNIDAQKEKQIVRIVNCNQF